MTINMKRVKSIASWFTINSVFALLAYFGFAEGSDVAANAFIWATIGINCLLFLVAVLIVMFHKNHDFKARMTDKTGGNLTSVPLYVDIMYDIGMVVFLTHYMAWVALGLYTVHIFLQKFIIDFTRSHILPRVQSQLFANMDTEDEDRDELIRLGVINTERD